MADRRDTTQVNEDANKDFNGKDDLPAAKTLDEAKSVQDVNEAADAEFNGDQKKPVLGTNVGGLSGSSD
jgi:hypothetical protein